MELDTGVTGTKIIEQPEIVSFRRQEVFYRLGATKGRMHNEGVALGSKVTPITVPAQCF